MRLLCIWLLEPRVPGPHARSIEPTHGLIEQVSAHRETGLEGVAGDLLASADAAQRHALVGDDPKRSLGCVGRGGVPVGVRDVARKFTATDNLEVGREHYKIETIDHGRLRPGE